MSHIKNTILSKFYKYSILLNEVLILFFPIFFPFKVDASIKMSGSSTVYPFAIVMAQEFAFKTNLQTPTVESVGTGGGFSIFCKGNGANYPDIVNASRLIKKNEINECKKNDVSFVEKKIGLDAIVIAMHNFSKKDDSITSLTSDEIFNSLARNVVIDGKVVPNPYKKWNEINPRLPNLNIVFYGPPSTSGTRDSFTEIVLTEYCMQKKEFQKHFPDKLKQNCSLIRNDGHFIESGENDTFIVHKISLKSGAIGIFGYSHYMENKSKINVIKIDNVTPSSDTISTRKYKISRPLYLYFKNASLQNNPSVKLFYQEVTSDDAIGKNGYLQDYHLVISKDTVSEN